MLMADLLSQYNFIGSCYLILRSSKMIFFFFLIRNEEKCINRRKDIGERKDTKEREETKGRMRGPSYTN